VAKRELRLWPDQVLSRACAPVDVIDLRLSDVIEDLFDTMYDAKGRGLAGPQIGVLSCVFVVDATWKEGHFDPRVFINPQVVATDGGDVQMDEECLSIPDLPMAVTRPSQVHLRWSDRYGAAMEGRFDGVLGRCIQHEFDHLAGTVIFDHQSAVVRADLEARYAP